jgi:hypothetical protein
MVEVDPPAARVCERCGRREEWDPERTSWSLVSGEDRGTPQCLHEWDINGAYNPLTE